MIMHSRHVLTSVNFVNNNDYSIQLNKWFLISIGAWPQTSTLKKILASILVLIFAGAAAIITIPCFFYVCFENDNIYIKLNALLPLLHRVVGITNYWVLLKRNRDIQNCVRHMETDWKLIQRINDREVMLRHAKIGRYVAGFCAAFMHSGSFFFTAAKVLKTTTFVVGNETFRMHPMTCPMYSKIVDARFSPANEILLIVQFISVFALNSATVAICSLAAVFAVHARGQLHVLYTWLKQLVEEDKPERKSQAVEKRLAAIVEHHLRVLSFITQMESILHKVCLVEVVGSTLNMCLLGYYSIMNWGSFDAAKILSYIYAYFSLSFIIFIFCYIGEILTEQCKNVGEVAYMTDWYKLHHKTALCLILIIIRSSQEIKITAGKLFQLSIATFGDIIKTSMAYLNILRALTT